MTTPTRADAEALDRDDQLSHVRHAFDLPEGIIYLDGNSLGPPPKTALARIANVANQEWRNGLIKSWNDAGWIDLAKKCGGKIAPLIGVDPDEVIIADSVSVNIFKLAAALSQRHDAAIAYERGEFPTDGYILQGLSALTGVDLIEVTPDDDIFPQKKTVLIKSAVHYKTAEIANIAELETEAKEHGSSIIWDLSHATGVIDLALKKNGASYAVGCGYKFLNGGPGAPAFIYAAKDKASTLHQPLCGWMGHAAPFDFAGDYKPASGVERFACGTPPILSLSALDAALDLFTDLEMQAVHAKAMALGDFFLRCTEDFGLPTVSPGIGSVRGGHVCLSHDNGYAIMQALIARNIIGDFRAPDLMRFGFAPLYLRFTDIWGGANQLKDILRTEEWKRPEFSVRGAVT